MTNVIDHSTETDPEGSLPPGSDESDTAGPGSPTGWLPPSPGAEPAPSSPRGRLLAAVAVTAVLASGLGAGVGVMAANQSSDSTTIVRQDTARAAAAIDTVSIVANSKPSVVSINTITTGTDIFQQPVTEQGTGTGFVASADGLIYTNAHVVGDAIEVDVTLEDGTTKKGKVVGVNATDDLAVVKIEATGLVPLPIGSSADMRVGDPVVAIGNSLALPGGPTATEGIVSALNRSIDTSNGEYLARLIQTDAAINPGNSGGPLLNAKGEVIGINTAGATDAQNVGFAIALDTAKPILDELAKGRPWVKAFLGVQTQDVTTANAGQLGVSVDQGAYVQGVTGESGAEVAGVQVGDVIIKVDDTEVKVGTDLRLFLSAKQAGDKVTITVQRGDTTKVLDAVLGSVKA
jgi:putative serine protease PepD